MHKQHCSSCIPYPTLSYAVSAYLFRLYRGEHVGGTHPRGDPEGTISELKRLFIKSLGGLIYRGPKSTL